MKQVADKSTVDLFQDQKRRGRPVTGTAKTNAQRMKEYRQRRKEKGVILVVQHSSDLQDRINELKLISQDILTLKKERDDALKLVNEYRNALQQLKADL